MALTDIFTGGSTKKAAVASQQFLQGQLRDLQNLLYGGQERGINQLLMGGGQASDILSGALPGATSALVGGTNAARQALAGSGIDVRNILEGTALPRALSELDPSINRASRGANLYDDLLGINGPEGSARAMAAFKTSPSYEFNLGQGLEAINRRRAAAGELVGGNADREAQDYGAGLASQEFGNFRNALSAYGPQEAQLRSTAATGLISPIYQSLANFLGNQGVNLSNLESTGGKNLASLISGFAGQQAGIPQDVAARIAQLISSTGGQFGAASANLGKSITDALITGGKASDQGVKNIFDLIGAGTKFVGSGGIGGLKTGINDLSNLFG